MMRSIALVGIAVFITILATSSPAEATHRFRATAGQPISILAQAGGNNTETYQYEVSTIPAFRGVKVTLDGVTQTTNSLGKTTFTVQRIEGDLDEGVGARISVETDELEIDERTVARYARPAERKQSVALMYSRYYKTAFDFVDANGTEIPNSSVENTIIKSSTGEALEIDVNGENWLLGSRVSGSAKPVIKPVFWTINDVIIDATSVAHRGQTKFFPETESLISSNLLLFDVRFRTVDAFFGFPAGEQLSISTPSGDQIDLNLEDGIASIDQLPRGEYTVIIEGSGLRIGRPVTLTRNQDLRLLYYTRLDLGIVMLSLAGFLVLPFVIGRRRRRARHANEVVSPPEPTKSLSRPESAITGVVEKPLLPTESEESPA